MRAERLVRIRYLGGLAIPIALAIVTGGCGGPGTPALPSAWKTVTYRGVAIDVPKTWTVEPWTANCGVRSPTVFLGPQRLVQMKCLRDKKPAAQVVLGSLFPFPAGSGTAATINGLNAKVVTNPTPRRNDVTSIWVRLPDKGFSIAVAVGQSADLSGGAPGRASQIVNTIHTIGG